MSVGVCFRRENKSWEQDQWSFVFSNFGITNIWERGVDDNRDYNIYQKPVPVRTAAQLPQRPIVVLAPEDGNHIKGTVSLTDYVHPEDAIYLFGSSNAALSDEEDLGGVIPEACVYIPTVKHEMYAHAAGYITLYDRMVKRGSHG